MMPYLQKKDLKDVRKPTRRAKARAILFLKVIPCAASQSDTTLRMARTPGASMNLSEKLDVARQLARLGVDVIEAGSHQLSGD